MKKLKLLKGNNLELLKKIPDNSIDSVVSDPPYGLSFMNKKWDYDVPSVEFWKEVYRVLKPGGHILSFGGTRTYHRMVVNIEDAGFEIRDQIMWLYGSGFPKSHNIGKAVDKLEGNEREVVMRNPYADGSIRKATGNVGKDDNVEFLGSYELENGLRKDTKGSSPYEGWGTALKPANEPICVARKPLSEKSVAENVLKWNTGGINIDGCRIGSDTIKCGNAYTGNSEGRYNWNNGTEKEHEGNTYEGRFPANLILDEVAAQMLDEQSGISKSNCKSGVVEGKDANVFNDGKNKTSGHKKKIMVGDYSDKGGASRFFYIPKVSKKERNMGLDGFDDAERHYNISTAVSNAKHPVKNNHPTVKPVQLMAYLCRLITPENGIILDPYMGSGSTGIAALLEGFRFCGMEMDEDYFKIAESRIENYEQYREFLEKKKK